MFSSKTIQKAAFKEIEKNISWALSKDGSIEALPTIFFKQSSYLRLRRGSNLRPSSSELIHMKGVLTPKTTVPWRTYELIGPTKIKLII